MSNIRIELKTSFSLTLINKKICCRSLHFKIQFGRSNPRLSLSSHTHRRTITFLLFFSLNSHNFRPRFSMAPSKQVPLIEPHPIESDPELDKSLKTFENFLALIGFRQCTVLGTALSWLVFVLLVVALPLLSIQFSYCSNCEKYEVKSLELEILVSQTVVSAISLLSISHILRKYGVRKMLFVDYCHGHFAQFRHLYLQKIRVRFTFIVELLKL